LTWELVKPEVVGLVEESGWQQVERRNCFMKEIDGHRVVLRLALNKSAHGAGQCTADRLGRVGTSSHRRLLQILQPITAFNAARRAVCFVAPRSPSRAQARLGSEVNPVVRSLDEWEHPQDALVAQIQASEFVDVLDTHDRVGA
jgi:hypothetical protein